MKDLYLQDIYIYPIKSLGGISVHKAEVQQTGLQYDRRWMLTDEDGNFLSQRNITQMALLQVNFVDRGLSVSDKKGTFSPLIIPFNTHTGKEVTVKIWDDQCMALEVNNNANEWFSHALKMKIRLVYMPDTSHRPVEPDYAIDGEIVSFADAYPFMMIGQSSLNNLNSRLNISLPMNRFRPNFVFSGGNAYCEDTFDTLNIGPVRFKAVKPCYRCVITTINQELATKGQEPLRTLATYRAYKNKVMFGQNLLQLTQGVVEVGNQLLVHEWK